MVERKPAGMSWESFAEQQIQAAQREGHFDHLSGAGKAIPSLSEHWDENSWMQRKLKEENVAILPPLLQAKRDIEQTRLEIGELTSEEIVRSKLEGLQKRVMEAIRSPVPSPAVVVLPIDMEEELQRWRKHRTQTASDSSIRK